MNPDPLFETLEPPPGGLPSLRARLRAEQRRAVLRRRAWATSIAAGAAAAVVAAAIVLAPGPSSRQTPSLPDDPALAALALTDVESASVQVPDESLGAVAVERVPLSTTNVVYYRVASLR